MKRTLALWIHLFLLFSVASELGAQALRRKPYSVLGVTRRLEVAPDDASQLAVDTVNPNLVEAKDLFFPSAVAVDTTTTPPSVFVADSGNHRVLGWRNAAGFANGAPADLVIGQKDFFTAVAQGPGRGLTTGFNFPTGLVVDRAGNLYVADYGDNRILRFPKPFQQQQELVFPDMVIGQTSFNASAANSGGLNERSLAFAISGVVLPVGMVFDQTGNLYVTDIGNNRVLRYAASELAAGNNAPRANLVLGQINFTSSAVPAERITKDRMIRPTGIAIDPSGRIYVIDAGLRILFFEANATGANGAAASRLLGIAAREPNQPALPFINEYSVGNAQGSPAEGIVVVDNRLLVIDSPAHRLTIYDPPESWPAETTNAPSPPAKVVVGQPDFRSGAVLGGGALPTASNFANPSSAIYVNGELYVVDSGSHRVLVFRQQGGTFVAANRVLGQIGLDLGSANSPDGREFNLPNGLAIDSSATPPRLFVADYANHRILGFRNLSAARTGAKADIVIGQVDFLRTLINSPGNDPEKPTQTGLYFPAGVTVDSAGNLYVADSGNGRVLRFPKPFEQTGEQRADLVIGQAGFTSKVIDPTSRTMREPYGVALSRDGFDASRNAGGLIVTDVRHHRALYFPKPFSNGMSATNVIGQQDFFASTAGGSTTNRFNAPRHVALDPEDRLYVVDSGNSRVRIFDRVTQLPAFPTPLQSIFLIDQSGFNGISGIAISKRTGVIWVTEAEGSRVVRYRPFDAVSQTNITSDSFVGAVRPIGVAVDPYDNLVVSDSANRVLYFVPSLSVTNGANFSGGSLAPGTIASIFPFNNGTCGGVSCARVNLGTETRSFNELDPPLPLPRELGGLEVQVNEKAAPLFYVSPAQINFTLPNSLPQSGTATVTVRNVATGQIYGTMDMGLRPTSPGLFTQGANGSGTIAALNQDNSAHTPTNPIAPGEVIQIFGTGPGVIPGGPEEGTLTPLELFPTPVKPRVTIGGRVVPDENVEFSGLAPGLLAGVWQVNVRVPLDAPLGNSVQVVIFLNDVSTQDPNNAARIRSTIAIRQRTP